MYSFLEVEGTYDPGRKFAFTNISDKPFESKWNGIPVTIGAKETIEISDVTPFPGSGMGHCLAVKFTKELVEQIMFGLAKADEIEKKTPFYRSPLGTQVGVPYARKEYEDKILKEIIEENEGVQVKVLAKQKADEIRNDMAKKEGVSYEPAKEFAEVPKGPQPHEPKPVKKPVKTKKVETS